MKRNQSSLAAMTQASACTDCTAGPSVTRRNADVLAVTMFDPAFMFTFPEKAAKGNSEYRHLQWLNEP